MSSLPASEPIEQIEVLIPEYTELKLMPIPVFVHLQAHKHTQSHKGDGKKRNTLPALTRTRRRDKEKNAQRPSHWLCSFVDDVVLWQGRRSVTGGGEGGGARGRRKKEREKKKGEKGEIFSPAGWLPPEPGAG